MRDGEGFILVYSITSRASFSRIRKFHDQIQRVKESTASSPTMASSSMPQSFQPTVPAGPAPVMLIGNKVDRITEREVSTQEGSALAKDLGCEFIEASAKNCINVERAFFDVVRQLRRQRLAPQVRPGGERRSTNSGGSSGKSGGRKDGGKGGKGSGYGNPRSSKCVIL